MLRRTMFLSPFLSASSNAVSLRGMPSSLIKHAMEKKIPQRMCNQQFILKNKLRRDGRYGADFFWQNNLMTDSSTSGFPYKVEIKLQVIIANMNKCWGNSKSHSSSNSWYSSSADSSVTLECMNWCFGLSTQFKTSHVSIIIFR